MRILLIVAIALIVFLAFRKRGKKAPVELTSSSAAVDRWLKESLPAVLAAHLATKGIDRAHVATTLGGDPDASVVSAIEGAVKAIEIEYVREAHASNLEVRARVRFDDGSEENISTHIAYTEAPASVRDDFERKATTRAFRKWDFPWMSTR
jgi:hypothetical protein